MGDRYVECSFDPRRIPFVGHRAVAHGSMLTMRPLSFWLYVLAGAMMIIASAIALPFLPARSR